MYKKLIIAVACAALSIPAMGGIVATFDWAEASGGWWYNQAYVETDNGITMSHGGRVYADPTAGVGGAAIKPSYPDDGTQPGTLTVSAGLFEVLSVDLSMVDGTGGEIPLFQGMLGGVEQWSITSPNNATLVTYTAGDTGVVGDMTLQIDTILITGFDNGGATWGYTVDNLVVDAVPEPATLGLLGLAGAALYVRRKLHI